MAACEGFTFVRRVCSHTPVEHHKLGVLFVGEEILGPAAERCFALRPETRLDLRGICNEHDGVRFEILRCVLNIDQYQSAENGRRWHESQSPCVVHPSVNVRRVGRSRPSCLLRLGGILERPNFVFAVSLDYEEVVLAIVWHHVLTEQVNAE